VADFNTNTLMPTALPQQTNPLEFASQAIGVRNALLGNKIQQAKYDAEMAQGNALAASIGQDGRPDQHAYLRNLADDPNGRYGLTGAVTTSQDQEARALQNSDAGRNSISSVLSFVGQHPDQEHLIAGVRMAKSVLPKTQWGQVDAIARRISDHPDGIAGGVAQIVNASQAGAQQQANVYGTPGATVDNGKQIVIGTQQSSLPGPNAGQFQPNNTVQKYTSPEFDQEPFKTVGKDANGNLVEGVVQKGSLFNQGNGGTLPPGYNGRPSSNSNPPGFVQTGVAAGTDEAVKQGTTIHGADTQTSQTLADQTGTISNILNDIDQLPGGLRSQPLVWIANNASKIGLNGGDDYAGRYQDYVKNSTILASQLQHSMGMSGTNQQAEAALHIVPGPDLTLGEARVLARKQLGNITMAKTQIAGRQNLPAQDVTRYTTQFNSAVDPRFYWMQSMTPEQRTDFRSELKKSGQLDGYYHSLERFRFNLVHIQRL